MWLSTLFVATGGGIGAALRFWVATLVTRFYPGLFPAGTFLINVSGSFLIGVVMTFFMARPALSPNWRFFLVTGVLGGYTTFSSFEWETLSVWKAGSLATAAANVTLSVVLGFIGVWLGNLLAHHLRQAK
jgi:fluoride exporter